MDFDEITLVVPWLELALDLGIDPDAPQVAEPRAFKSHLNWHDVPKGGRYITMVRDPGDVLVSMYHFHEGWRFEAGSIPWTTTPGISFWRGSGTGATGSMWRRGGRNARTRTC